MAIRGTRLLMLLSFVAPLSACSGPAATWIELLPVAVLEPGGAEVGIELDRQFAAPGGHVLQMDRFYPLGAGGPTPAVILVHGGFWLYGERTDTDDWAADLARQGYSAFSIDYRLIPEGGTYPAPVADVLSAIAYVREHAPAMNVDPGRIGLMGISAGAHLVLLAGLAADAHEFDADWPIGESAGVRGIVEIYGPTDFTVDRSTAQGWQIALVESFLGAGQDARPDLWREASPVTHVRGDGPAVFIAHGTADPIVPVEQARSLRAALMGAGEPYRYIALTGASHFWGSYWFSAEAQSIRGEVLRFLAETLNG